MYTTIPRGTSVQTTVLIACHTDFVMLELGVDFLKTALQTAFILLLYVRF